MHRAADVIIRVFGKSDIAIGTANQRVGLYWLFIVLKVDGNRWELITTVYADNIK